MEQAGIVELIKWYPPEQILLGTKTEFVMNTNFFIGFSVVTARPHEGGRAGSGEAVVSQNNLSLDMIRGAGNCHCILHLQSDSFHTFPGISIISMTR